MWIHGRPCAVQDRRANRRYRLADAFYAFHPRDGRLTRRTGRHQPLHVLLLGLLRARQVVGRRISRRINRMQMHTNVLYICKCTDTDEWESVRGGIVAIAAVASFRARLPALLARMAVGQVLRADYVSLLSVNSVPGPIRGPPPPALLCLLLSP